jgi:CRP/FNR family nitrogen fixation transcriptional regulator
VVDCEIALVDRVALIAAAGRDAAASQSLWALTARELKRAQDHLLLLGRKNAQERLVAFLLGMSARDPAGNVVHLAMSRTDIADYLGLTIETVSRMFTQLERERSIALPSSRHVVMRNREALAALGC